VSLLSSQPPGKITPSAGDVGKDIQLHRSLNQHWQAIDSHARMRPRFVRSKTTLIPRPAATQSVNRFTIPYSIKKSSVTLNDLKSQNREARESEI